LKSQLDKQIEAEQRAKLRKELGDVKQLEHLDKFNLTAKRERARLTRRINDAKQTASRVEKVKSEKKTK